MSAISSVKFITKVMAAVALTTIAPAPSETAKFLVECHAFVSAKGNVSKEYAYSLNAFGYPVAVKDGIDVNLDEKNVFLSVESKQPNAKAYSTLYTELPLVRYSTSACVDEKCKQVVYEPKRFEGTIVVTYDKDSGIIYIKHVLAPATVVQAKGGCLFVPLQPNK
ncbi:MAG: hypothetical protein JOZ78_19065 [Chroococcidiopsidaceae cyanobacterium CP_BM_ER_R8_30]|nr:hypothetical protein [Chroococcidiopsidaceae cyanobacterium CP_BM_ER_R8_30]